MDTGEQEIQSGQEGPLQPARHPVVRFPVTGGSRATGLGRVWRGMSHLPPADRTAPGCEPEWHLELAANFRGTTRTLGITGHTGEPHSAHRRPVASGWVLQSRDTSASVCSFRGFCSSALSQMSRAEPALCGNAGRHWIQAGLTPTWRLWRPSAWEGL